MWLELKTPRYTPKIVPLMSQALAHARVTTLNLGMFLHQATNKADNEAQGLSFNVLVDLMLRWYLGLISWDVKDSESIASWARFLFEDMWLLEYTHFVYLTCGCGATFHWSHGTSA